jgi:hypothetical protein
MQQNLTAEALYSMSPDLIEAIRSYMRTHLGPDSMAARELRYTEPAGDDPSYLEARMTGEGEGDLPVWWVVSNVPTPPAFHLWPRAMELAPLLPAAQALAIYPAAGKRTRRRRT